MSDEHVGDASVPIDTADAVDERSRRAAAGSITGQELTPREEAALRRARGLSKLLDEAFVVPRTNYRIGLDPILGILPGAGDAVAAVVSLYPIIEAYRFGASKGTLAKMLTLVGVDAVIGSVPLIGPVIDAVWKANMWNLETLERQIQKS